MANAVLIQMAQHFRDEEDDDDYVDDEDGSWREIALMDVDGVLALWF